jgi:hypothetical protein
MAIAFSGAVYIFAIWFDLLQEAKIAYSDTGSLHVACRSDEVAEAREFAEIGLFSNTSKPLRRVPDLSAT